MWGEWSEHPDLVVNEVHVAQNQAKRNIRATSDFRICRCRDGSEFADTSFTPALSGGCFGRSEIAGTPHPPECGWRVPTRIEDRPATGRSAAA